MSARRQQLRAELQEKERKAAFSSTSPSQKSGKVDQQDRVEKLRKEGRELRKEYAARTFSMAATTASVAEQKSDEDQARYQVRLKWSRRSSNTNFPTEESLKLFLGEKFGPVSTVEFLGSKGNAALITFVNFSSVKECIDSLLDSSVMRAYHVGKQTKVEDDILPPSDFSAGGTTHFETIHNRRLRQNEEREKLRRQMEELEEDENGLDKASTRIASNATKKSYSATDSSSNTATTYISSDLMSVLYPPQLPLPLSDAEEHMTDLERLEHMEQMVLPKCVSFI
jgi:DnaJ family protein C protein 17